MRLPFPYLAAERAGVLGVLGDFHLLHHLTQRSTISGTVFTDDSNFPGTLGLKRGEILPSSAWLNDTKATQNMIPALHNTTVYPRKQDRRH